jgi:GNAT superfamily N-acetyltransferase
MGIRSAVPADAAAIYELINSLAHCFCEAPDADVPDWFTQATKPSVIAARIDDHDYRSYVYMRGEDLIGYIAIRNNQHLYYLFVDQGYHGQGIARQLWDHARSMSDSDHFVVRSSVYAVPVYEKFGFVINGPVSVKDGIAFQPMELRS